MGIPGPINESLRVVIIAKSSRERLNLKSILEKNDLIVVADSLFIESLSEPSADKVADVLLIDLDESDHHSIEVLDQIMEKTDVPVLFNDSAATCNHFSSGGEAWGKYLAKKLLELANSNTLGRVVEKLSFENIESSSQDKIDNDKVDKDKIKGKKSAVDSVEQYQNETEELTQLVSDFDSGAVFSNQDGEQAALDNTEKTDRVVPIRSADVEIESVAAHKMGSIVNKQSIDGDDSVDTEDDDIDIGKYKRKIAEFKSTEFKSIRALENSGNVLSKGEVKTDKAKLTGAKKLLNKLKRKQKIVTTQVDKEIHGADRVWVLGASIGGPQAVEEFLIALPSNLPIAFVLAQHIGSSFVSLLAEQLDRKCKLQVTSSTSGRLLKNSQVIISPVNQRVVFDQSGHVILKPQVHKTTYNPSIDGVLTEVASRYGSRAGAIIFSGMGNDGAEGVKEIQDNGGVVWAQDAESCVISAMADCARKSGCVEFSGSPTQLARRLVIFLTKSEANKSKRDG